MNESIELFRDVIEQGGPWWLGVIGAVVVGIRGYRHPVVQGMIPVVAQWSNLPKVARWGIVFGAALAASTVGAVLAGKALGAAALAAIPVALAAVAGHKATKKIGHAQTGRSLATKGFEYQPSKPREAMSIVVPLDRKRIARVARLARSVREVSDATGD